MCNTTTQSSISTTLSLLQRAGEDVSERGVGNWGGVEMEINGVGAYSGPGDGMKQLLRNESSSDSLAALLAPGGLQGGRLEDVAVAVVASGGGVVGQKRPLFAAYADGPTVEDGPGEDGDDDGLIVSPGGSSLEKKRRLTFDQVRSLERNFEMENKLEPERKMQLAKDLGLRPRQVAVWFQNRRARWKTKQLERDYEALAAEYDRLKAEYEQVVGEKNHLKAEVQRLAGVSTPGGVGADDIVPADNPENQTGEFITTMARHLHNARPSPTLDVSLSFKEDQTSVCTDGSNSSDVLDADSPRTSDSSSPTSNHSTTTTTTHHQSGDFPPPESCFTALNMDLTTTTKLDAAFHEVDQSSNYLLLHLDEQSVLPWWDWP